jgi:hypothetical protein
MTRISSTSPGRHEFPHERSDLGHWRKRLGDKLELLLAEGLRVAHASGALRTRDLKRATVDTTDMWTAPSSQIFERELYAEYHVARSIDDVQGAGALAGC